MDNFLIELSELIWKNKIHEDTKTDASVLADYLGDCIRAWNRGVQTRDVQRGVA